MTKIDVGDGLSMVPGKWEFDGIESTFDQHVTRSVPMYEESHYMVVRLAEYFIGNASKILDVGCGKGFLLYDFLKVIPDAEIYGIDISDYAIANSKPEIRDRLQVGNAINLPWEDNSFDLVVSITTLHNLHAYDLDLALREMERVGKRHKYLCVESYRNEQEKVNLLYWQVTCEAFNTPEEWDWWFQHSGYTGDHSFIYFE